MRDRLCTLKNIVFQFEADGQEVLVRYGELLILRYLPGEREESQMYAIVRLFHNPHA